MKQFETLNKGGISLPAAGIHKLTCVFGMLKINGKCVWYHCGDYTQPGLLQEHKSNCGEYFFDTDPVMEMQHQCLPLMGILILR